MRRKLLIIMVMLLAVTSFQSCKTYKDIKVTSFGLKSVTPSGFRSLGAVVSLGIENPILAFRVNDLDVNIKMNGAPFLNLTSDGLIVEGHKTKDYEVALKGSMDENFNLLTLLSLLKYRDLSPFTVDVKVFLALKNGLGKTLEFNDIQVTSLVDSL